MKMKRAANPARVHEEMEKCEGGDCAAGRIFFSACDRRCSWCRPMVQIIDKLIAEGGSLATMDERIRAMARFVDGEVIDRDF